MSSLTSKVLEATKPCVSCGNPAEANGNEPVLCDDCYEEIDKLFERQRYELSEEFYEPEFFA